MLKRKSSAKNLLTVDIRDIHQLQFRYMPFVEQGGLFIETSEHYELGEQFFLLLRLMDEVEQLLSRYRSFGLPEQTLKILTEQVSACNLLIPIMMRKIR